MKRYKVINHDFDSRCHILQLGYADEMNDAAKQEWELEKQRLVMAIAQEYGAIGLEQIVDNFKEIGTKPLSIVAFHNSFFSQSWRSFIHGNYYPALTAVCALGERVLNHLILLFRDEFKSTEAYKKVCRKDSFDNWDLAIDSLISWKIIRLETAEEFRKLKILRHQSIHFRPDLDQNVRSAALNAISVFKNIISLQFASFGDVPWFITEIRGASYIRKSYEKDLFVSKIVIPNCVLVGHKSRMEYMDPGWRVIDDHEYESEEISDETFKALVDP